MHTVTYKMPAAVFILKIHIVILYVITSVITNGQRNIFYENKTKKKSTVILSFARVIGFTITALKWNYAFKNIKFMHLVSSWLFKKFSLQKQFSLINKHFKTSYYWSDNFEVKITVSSNTYNLPCTSISCN